MQSNRLHMEAALLSNTLHEFRDDDIEGLRPVISQIEKTRAEWTQVQKTIEYFDKTGALPPADVQHSVLTPVETGPGVAELKMELSKLNVNISKYKGKLELNPDHKKSEQWKEDLGKMEALKIELKENIVKLTYASK